MSATLTSAPEKNSRKFLTYEDYLTFPDSDGIKKEIIEGELYMSPAPSIKHQAISKRLFRILDNYAYHNNSGEVYYAPCDVIFSDINIMQPDILFIAKNNYQILSDLNIQGAPDLLVEILSPSSIDTDRIFKKHIYEHYGVKEYWIVDPDTETIEIWALKNKIFQLASKSSKNQTVKSQLLKKMEIDLSNIFNS